MKKFRKLFLIILIFSFIINAAACSPPNGNENKAEMTTKFIAHRGLSSIYYENSEAAFIGAAQNNFFWGIETDFWRTSDGVWVSAHDVNPFEDDSVLLTEIDYAEAVLLPLKQNGTEQSQNVYLCSAERYLQICSEYGKTAVIELKYQADKEALASLLTFVEEHIELNKTMFISFHTSVISSLKKLNDDITAMSLTSNPLYAAVYIQNSTHIGIDSDIFSDDILSLAKGKGLLVNVWTVNDIQIAQQLIEKNVDFITTDYVFDFNSIE